MATVFRTRRNVRIVVYSNDHPPAHVHALAAGREARFVLNCPDGPVELWDHVGPWKLAELNEIGGEIAERLAECCRTWKDIHG
jgi:hypothetical protein